MRFFLSVIIFFVLFPHLHAQNPDPALVGYWHNWSSANAPYINLDQIDSRYNIIEVAFAVTVAGTTYDMEFSPSSGTQEDFIERVHNLQAEGKKVLISIGGGNGFVQINSLNQKNTFIASMNDIINTYDFDGIDIDLEGSSVSVSGGTIANPVDSKIKFLIKAIKTIMADYYNEHGKHLILTMAPETAYVQGGMSAYNGVWGAYLPLIHALRDSIEILQVQLYNSGTMYGIDGDIYSVGTADFIISQTEAVLQGFSTAGGDFEPLQPHQVAVGLPACPNAAGSGYITPGIVKDAVDYLLGNGPRPGYYVKQSSYPGLRGMMTWSINWDKKSSCGGTYQYAQNFEAIFGDPEGIPNITNTIKVFPNPVNQGDFLSFEASFKVKTIRIYNNLGQMVDKIPFADNRGEIFIRNNMSPGLYTFIASGDDHKRILGKLIIMNF